MNNLIKNKNNILANSLHINIGIKFDYKDFKDDYESELYYRIQLLKYFKHDIDENTETNFLELMDNKLPSYIENIYNFLNNLEDKNSKLYLQNILKKLEQNFGLYINNPDNPDKIMLFCLLFSYDTFDLISNLINNTINQNKILELDYKNIIDKL